jgi:hypothetical protein
MATRIVRKKDLTYHTDFFTAPAPYYNGQEVGGDWYAYGGAVDFTVYGSFVPYMKRVNPVSGHPGQIKFLHPVDATGGGMGVYSERCAFLKDLKRVASVLKFSRVSLAAEDWISCVSLSDGQTLMEIHTGYAGADRQYSNFVVHFSKANTTRIEVDTGIEATTDTYHLFEIVVDYASESITFKINGTAVYQVTANSAAEVLAEFDWDTSYYKPDCFNAFSKHASTSLAVTVDEFGWEVADQDNLDDSPEVDRSDVEESITHPGLTDLPTARTDKH